MAVVKGARIDPNRDAFRSGTISVWIASKAPNERTSPQIHPCTQLGINEELGPAATIEDSVLQAF
jgi:hypothetical protein